MPRVNVHIRKKNWLKWLLIKNKSEFVNKALEKSVDK